MTESAHNGDNSLSNTSKTLLFYYGELSSWEIYLTRLPSQHIMSLWLSQERKQCLLRAQGYKQESLPGGCSTSCTSFLLEHCLWHRWDTQAVLTELSEGHTAGLAELSADSLQLGELRAAGSAAASWAGSQFTSGAGTGWYTVHKRQMLFAFGFFFGSNSSHTPVFCKADTEVFYWQCMYWRTLCLNRPESSRM